MDERLSVLHFILFHYYYFLSLLVLPIIKYIIIHSNWPRSSYLEYMNFVEIGTALDLLPCWFCVNTGTRARANARALTGFHLHNKKLHIIIKRNAIHKCTDERLTKKKKKKNHIGRIAAAPRIISITPVYQKSNIIQTPHSHLPLPFLSSSFFFSHWLVLNDCQTETLRASGVNTSDSVCVSVCVVYVTAVAVWHTAQNRGITIVVVVLLPFWYKIHLITMPLVSCVRSCRANNSL